MSNLRLTSRWFSQDEAIRFLELVRRGDLLEFHRGHYSHWAVYAGQVPMDNYGGVEDDDDIFHVDHHGNEIVPQTHAVIHRANPDRGQGAFSASLTKAFSANGGDIVLEPLSDIWHGAECRINNALDRKIPPFESEEEIVERAWAFLRGEGGREGTFLRAYNVVDNNCEHFATWVRNGWAISEQVTRRIKQVASVGVVFAAGMVARPLMLAAGLGMMGLSALQQARPVQQVREEEEVIEVNNEEGRDHN